MRCPHQPPCNFFAPLTLEWLPLFSARNRTRIKVWRSGPRQELSVERPGFPSCMWSNSGRHEPPTAWQADKATTVIKATAQFVCPPGLRVLLGTSMMSNGQEFSKNIYRTFPDLLRQAGVETKVVDTFRLAWVGDRNSKGIRANIRVLMSLLSFLPMGGLMSRHSPSELDESVPAGSCVPAEQELFCLVTDMRCQLRTPLSHALWKLHRSNRCPSHSRSSTPKTKPSPLKQRAPSALVEG